MTDLKSSSVSEPVASVIIPTYNGQKHLRETIESVLNQTFEDFELIIVDDASDDDTDQIVRDYLGDPRISYHPYPSNKGLGGNWNRGVSLAKGTYLKILCQDDLIAPDFLEKAIGILNQYDSVSLVTSYQKLIGNSDQVRKLNIFPSVGQLDGKKAQIHNLQHYFWIGSPSAVMFRRRDLKVGLFDASFTCSIDVEMWMRLLAVGNLYVIPRILCYSRVHGGQESMTCYRTLGFLRDEIRILYRIRNNPSGYSDWPEEEWRRAWNRYIRLFIRQSIRRRNVSIIHSLRFLNGKLTRTELAMFSGKVIVSFGTENRMTLAAGKFCRNLANQFLDRRWKNRFNFKRSGPDHETPEYLNEARSVLGRLTVPVNSLSALLYIPAGPMAVNLEETPHFRWISQLVSAHEKPNGDDEAIARSILGEYLNDYYPELDADTCLNRIRERVQAFLKDPENGKTRPPAVSCPVRDKKSDWTVIVMDGIEQACLAKLMEWNSILCYVTDRRMNPEQLARKVHENGRLIV